MALILADLSQGNSDWADVMFLVGCILAVIAAILAAVREVHPPLTTAVVGWLAVAFVALGLLLL